MGGWSKRSPNCVAGTVREKRRTGTNIVKTNSILYSARTEFMNQSISPTLNPLRSLFFRLSKTTTHDKWHCAGVQEELRGLLDHEIRLCAPLRY